MMTGRSERVSDARISSSVSSPPMPGMSTSRMAKLQPESARRLSASTPSVLSTTSQPNCSSRTRRAISLTVASSSQMSARMTSLGCPLLATSARGNAHAGTVRIIGASHGRFIPLRPPPYLQAARAHGRFLVHAHLSCMATSTLTSDRATGAAPGFRFWLAPVAVLVVSLVLTAFIHQAYRLGAARNDEARLARLGERVLAQLRGRVASANQALYGARAHVLNTGDLSRDSWAAYA